MANVLPKKDRETLRKNYWLRVVVTLACMFTAAMLIGTTSLIPSYLSARTDLAEVTRYEGLQGDAQNATDGDSATETARVVNAQIDQLLKDRNVNASGVIQQVMRDWTTHAEDIIISDFSYDVAGGDSSVPQLRVSGEARSRSTLNAFVQTLKADPVFTKVSFPVSDLAGSGNIVFSLVLEFKL